MVRACIALASTLCMLAGISAPAMAQDASADQAEIRTLMRKTWERPDAPLSVEPIVVVDDYAIAGWVQDDRGGRALLRKRHGKWDVVLCSGDYLRVPETVIATGAPPELASLLAARLQAAESVLPPQLLTKFSLFDGVVRRDGGPQHPYGRK